MVQQTDYLEGLRHSGTYIVCGDDGNDHRLPLRVCTGVDQRAFCKDWGLVQENGEEVL